MVSMRYVLSEPTSFLLDQILSLETCFESVYSVVVFHCSTYPPKNAILTCEIIMQPEFRLVMALPITIATCIGLMGYGWSAQERDDWIVPTVFFGIISFGCALGSTTSITFAVDSYRQYAGEALVTLNFSKSKFSISDGDHSALALSIVFRHLPRSSLLLVLQSLARCRRDEEDVCCDRQHSAGLLGNNSANVYLWQEGTNVDREEELDGKILMK